MTSTPEPLCQFCRQQEVEREWDHPCTLSFKHPQPSTKAVFISKDRTWTSQALFSFSELVISASKASYTRKSLFPWVSISRGASDYIHTGLFKIFSNPNAVWQSVLIFRGLHLSRQSWPNRSDLLFHTLGFTPLHSQAALHFSLLCSFKLCKLWWEVWS